MRSSLPTMPKTLGSGWSIRRATAAEHKTVTDLQLRLNRPCRSDSPIDEYFVAVGEQGIVGCGAVRRRGSLGYLYGLVVEKAWRRRGIGHALTQARLDWLQQENATSVFVLAMFWNIKFFRKHGFTLINKRESTRLSMLHRDFDDTWSNRSSLLFLGMSCSKVPSKNAPSLK